MVQGRKIRLTKRHLQARKSQPTSKKDPKREKEVKKYQKMETEMERKMNQRSRTPRRQTL